MRVWHATFTHRVHYVTQHSSNKAWFKSSPLLSSEDDIRQSELDPEEPRQHSPSALPESRFKIAACDRWVGRSLGGCKAREPGNAVYSWSPVTPHKSRQIRHIVQSHANPDTTPWGTAASAGYSDLARATVLTSTSTEIHFTLKCCLLGILYLSSTAYTQ